MAWLEVDYTADTPHQRPQGLDQLTNLLIADGFLGNQISQQNLTMSVRMAMTSVKDVSYAVG
ncbi:hypothetical protein GB937_006804 [Aspergillus fischeri]|nr:hypothetical protein GB937_006804 [Aspergillus fischeri]